MNMSPLRVHFQASASAVARRETFKGDEHLVVPVVMLRNTVVNGALVPTEALNPAAWNGVPVTVNHPMANGHHISANGPKVLEEWQVGMIFNSKVDGDKLKAEAWINVSQAEALLPGLVDRLESGEPMDVSTGYFPTSTKSKGVFNGKNYAEIHTELKPDHLALLPEEVGACSWQDGCGIRANRNGDPMTQESQESKSVLQILTRFLSSNARGKDDDRRQIVADLISNDASPFTPDDMYGLMDMTQDALEALRQQYLSSPEANKGDTLVSNCNKTTGAAAPVAPNSVASMSIEDFTALVSNASREAAEKALTDMVAANKTAELISGLAANAELGFTEDELKAMPLSALEKLAANAAKKADPAPKTNAKAQTGNFGARPMHVNADDGSKTEKKYAGMAANHAAQAAAKKEA